MENSAETSTAAETASGPPPPPPPLPPATNPRRPRVREVSSRFMSPLVSSSSSSESPNHQRHNLGSTPIPKKPSDPHSRPRSSSENRRRRQLDMDQSPSDSDPPPPPPPPPQIPASDEQFHFEHVPPSTLRRQRSAKLMKENIGNRQTPLHQNHHPSKKSAGGATRPDTPMLSASLDRSISVPSRFKGAAAAASGAQPPQRSSAAAKLFSIVADSPALDRHHQENAHLCTSSTQSLPELLLDSGRVKTSMARVSSDSSESLKVSAFPPARSVDGGERLPGGMSLPPPAPKVGPETRKAKKVSSHLDDFHSLKLLQNRFLQWRYANARAEASTKALERETQTKVNSLRVKMSEMYDSVAKKRIKLGILRRVQTLNAVLEAQVPYLDQWPDLEGDYSVSLGETTQALLNASIQLPLGGNVKVDVKELQESVNSAMKVMDSMVSHVQHLIPKAAETEFLMTELAKIVGGERALVEECGDLLYKTHALKVDESSLRAQLIQLQASS